MVRQSFNNRIRPIDLLQQEQPAHVVREGHWRQAQLEMTLSHNPRGKAIRAANDERHILWRVHDELGEFH